MFQLTNDDKFVCVNEWQGATRIHIRNYFKVPENGNLIPTKKGVALAIDEWNALKAQIDHIDAMIAFSEDECILGRKPSSAPPSSPQRPQSLIPEGCQYKPPSAESISRQLLQIRRTAQYQQPCEPEPFDC